MLQNTRNKKLSSVAGGKDHNLISIPLEGGGEIITDSFRRSKCTRPNRVLEGISGVIS